MNLFTGTTFLFLVTGVIYNGINFLYNAADFIASAIMLFSPPIDKAALTAFTSLQANFYRSRFFFLIFSTALAVYLFLLCGDAIFALSDIAKFASKLIHFFG